jgi:hypothetical protein
MLFVDAPVIALACVLDPRLTTFFVIVYVRANVATAMITPPTAAAAIVNLQLAITNKLGLHTESLMI